MVEFGASGSGGFGASGSSVDLVIHFHPLQSHLNLNPYSHLNR